MNRELPKDKQQAPGDAVDLRCSAERNFHNELLPKPSMLQTIQWTLALGSPIIMGPAAGAYAFMTTQTGSDFYGFALVVNTVLGFAIGASAGIVLAGLFYLFVIRRFSDTV